MSITQSIELFAAINVGIVGLSNHRRSFLIRKRLLLMKRLHYRKDLELSINQLLKSIILSDNSKPNFVREYSTLGGISG